MGTEAISTSTILEVKKEIESVLLDMNEVIGVGIDEPNQHIRVYVSQECTNSCELIPPRISGFDVDIILIPDLQTLGGNEFRSMRFRPVVGGVSAAHTGVTAGTIGAVIRNRVNGEKLLLSNNHVFANTSSTRNNRAGVGDAVIQPSITDRGTTADTIATLYKWIPFDDDGDNIVDAALARPLNQDDASPYILADEDLNVVPINGIRSITSTIPVKKYSRTSGLDRGRITDWNFSVVVDYDDHKSRKFVDQLLVDIETRGGDSGSLLLDDQNNAVGLIFAGGVDKSGRWFGVANKIRNVLAMFGDDVDISDGWSPNDAMMEQPPVYEITNEGV